MGKKELSPNWVQQTDIEEYLDFQRLWEILMIRLTSEAICKTIGSMMGSHGNNKILQPKYINMEMVLRSNLGLLHFLDSLIEDILYRALIKSTVPLH